MRRSRAGRRRLRAGIAADHGGFALKRQLAADLRKAKYEVVEFGARRLSPGNDYPDFVVPLARAVFRILGAKDQDRNQPVQ